MRSVAIGVFIAMSWVLFGAGISFAKDGGACRDDVKKFCSGVEPGKGRIRQCLQANRPQLSPSCQGKIEKRERIRQACKGDKERLCANVQAGGGRIRSCLREHEKDLSPECKSAIPHKPKSSHWENLKGPLATWPAGPNCVG